MFLRPVFTWGNTSYFHYGTTKIVKKLDQKESGAGFGNLADEGLKANIPKVRPSFIRQYITLNVIEARLYIRSLFCWWKRIHKLGNTILGQFFGRGPFKTFLEYS